MSKTTRINRPTTATSTKPRPGKMLHQSTNLAWAEFPTQKDLGSLPRKAFRKVGPGRTY